MSTPHANIAVLWSVVFGPTQVPVTTDVFRPNALATCVRVSRDTFDANIRPLLLSLELPVSPLTGGGMWHAAHNTVSGVWHELSARFRARHAVAPSWPPMATFTIECIPAADSMTVACTATFAVPEVPGPPAVDPTATWRVLYPVQ